MKPELPHDKALELLAQLRDAAIDRGISHQEIADKIGWGRSNVSRILRGAYMPKLDNFLKLAQAIGVQVKIKGIALLVVLGITSCTHELVEPVMPECPNVTILARYDGEIHIMIDSQEPHVTICNPDTGHCSVIIKYYYNCISMPITSILILNNQCIIQ